jgi:uncharacterized protein YndB with AHSA1/START domain
LIAALAMACSQGLAGEERAIALATKPSDREIVLTRAFSAPRRAVFDALTQPSRIVQWMKPTHMTLVGCDVDLRAGGSFRYVFQRKSGARIEVRGAYQTLDPPRGFSYLESYDFASSAAEAYDLLERYLVASR